MRPLVISAALAATLAGCTCAPHQASLTGCTGANGIACSERVAGTTTSHAPAKVQKVVAAKKEKFVQPDDKSNIVVNETSTVASKSEAPQPSQPDDTSDPVIKKAKVTVAAKMENPVSVEFREMKRADRKNADGKFVDSICGYVRGKTASGGEIGDKPFLYLVKEDEAYIGGYGICN
ncbi:unnamed protein product [marine sediment metagenome]|uniref:Lipoprotein n=1 Tax=marine sediment metagenome TaxID=412755 RepID=X0SAG3_9ZZZZ